MKKTVDYQTLILAELERIQTARTSLAGFVEYALGKTPALHHRLICDHVDRLLADEYDDLILLMPPNSAKSFYTSVAVPPYLLGRDPQAQILAISGTADLAQQWGRLARNNIADPTIRTLFPSLALSDDSRAVDSFSTTAGGTYRSFGVNSQVLGQRATILLIDDPLTSAANSLVTLRQLHSYFENEALTRLDPQRGKVILVCQRLDRNDLAGYLMDRDALEHTRRLKVLTLKMEAEEDDDDPLGRQPGDILWPERFTDLWVRDQKRDPFKWRTLFQQEPPSDTGQWCRPEWLQFVDTAPDKLTNYLMSDLALSIGTGDYSVHIVVGIDHAGRIYVLEAWRDRCSGDETAERHLQLCDEWCPEESLIDDDNASRMYLIALADRARAAGIPVPWKSMPIAGKDKQTRAAPLQALLRQLRIFMVRAPWNRWLMNQLLLFPTATGSGVDDGVDALGLIGRRLLQLGRPAGPVAPKRWPTVQSDMSLNELFEDNEVGLGDGYRRI